MKKVILIFVFLWVGFSAFSQVGFSIYGSPAYVNHLNRTGFGFSVGGELQLLKHFGANLEYRQYSSSYNRSQVDYSNVSAVAFSSQLNYIAINRGNHRFMLGTGFSTIHFKRFTAFSEDSYEDKNYLSLQWDYFGLRYDYTFKNNVMLGCKVNFYGDDGDDAEFFGVLIGYKIFSTN